MPCTPDDPALAPSAADVAQVLAMPARLRIARALLDGERSLDELRVRADVAPTELLAHLNLMCQQRVLAWRHVPHQVLYGLSPGALGVLASGLAGRMGRPPFQR